MKKFPFYILSLLVSCIACKGNKQETAKQEANQEDAIEVNVPEFNADSAYNYVKAQVDFGPRVPNTKEHVACGEFLADKLKEFGAKVTNQYADLIAYEGTVLKARNIIGAYKPESKRRVLLFAHWDTRPWADRDDKTNHHTPILGANDGASGVGVLLEIARLLNQETPEIGIDIIFFDAEDYGIPSFHEGKYKNDSWCLGSQYWSRNPHVEGYNARFGILLDMVGGKDATFYIEGYSNRYAKSVVDKVWNTAERLGYANYFVYKNGGSVIDDHLYVNTLARIPSIDIIPYDETDYYSSFGSFWHTLDDNMEIIDRKTLKAVGQTVLEVIYNEK